MYTIFMDWVNCNVPVPLCIIRILIKSSSPESLYVAFISILFFWSKTFYAALKQCISSQLDMNEKLFMFSLLAMNLISFRFPICILTTCSSLAAGKGDER